jgi:diguanylate cyclase (GGDEF)-like protein
MIQPGELSSKIIMLASTVGLNSGGVVAFIPSWRTAALYSIFMLMPAAIAMFYLGIHIALVVLLILFILYMTMIAIRGNREYWDALENELAGDAYLEKIADVFSGIFLRDTDFVARYGGEEFVLLLQNLDKNRAIELSERIRSEVENMTLFHYNHKIQATVSLGISSCVPQTGDKKEYLFKKADNALYQAKNSGRNQVVFYSDGEKC